MDLGYLALVCGGAFVFDETDRPIFFWIFVGILTAVDLAIHCWKGGKQKWFL